MQILNKKEGGVSKSRTTLIVLGLLLFICMLLFLVTSSSDKDSSSTPSNSKISENTTEDPSVMIPVAFEGNYTWEEIQPKLHFILVASGEENPESRYLNVANSLINLRKASTKEGITVMMILDRTVSYYEAIDDKGNALALSDALGLATAELEVE